MVTVPPLPKSFEDAARQHLAVEGELERVCGSSHFRSSKRSCEFLQYVVRVTLDGRTDSLKERSIGIDLFGRDISYEPSSDATVRVRANEVRKRLSSYYGSGPGTIAVRIDLPTGSYVPRFLPPASRATTLPKPFQNGSTETANPSAYPSGEQSHVPPILALTLMRPALLALLICTLLLRHQLESREEYLRFWDHLFAGRTAMVLSIPESDRASLAPGLYPVVWLAGRYGVNAVTEGDALAGTLQQQATSVQVSYASPDQLWRDSRLRWTLSPSPNSALRSSSTNSPKFIPVDRLDGVGRFDRVAKSGIPDPETPVSPTALLTILPEETVTLHIQGTDAISIRHLLEELTTEHSFPTGLFEIVDPPGPSHVVQIRIQRDSLGQWRRDVFVGGV